MSWYTKVIDDRQYTLWATPEYMIISDKVKTIATLTPTQVKELRTVLDFWLTNKHDT